MNGRYLLKTCSSQHSREQKIRTQCVQAAWEAAVSQIHVQELRLESVQEQWRCVFPVLVTTWVALDYPHRLAGDYIRRMQPSVFQNVAVGCRATWARSSHVVMPVKRRRVFPETRAPFWWDRVLQHGGRHKARQTMLACAHAMRRRLSP